MQSLTVDNATAAALTDLDGLVEVRDESGAVLGYFATVSPEVAARYADFITDGSGPNGRAEAGGAAGKPATIGPR
jgi:hypothetical protein